MFINLRKILDRRRISLREYVDFLGADEVTVQGRLEGGKGFTYQEFRGVYDLPLPKYSADFLFAETILENCSAWTAVRQSPYSSGERGDFLSLLETLPRNNSIL